MGWRLEASLLTGPSGTAKERRLLYACLMFFEEMWCLATLLFSFFSGIIILTFTAQYFCSSSSSFFTPFFHLLHLISVYHLFLSSSRLLYGVSE